MLIDSSLGDALHECTILVDARIKNLLQDEKKDSRILEAMSYSALSKGKRIRPFLLMVCANIFGIPPLFTLNAATAIELIHTYSLIHDDLPAMDNDDFRRNQPSNHKKFDEATAILAGDALLTYAFQILSSEYTHEDPEVRCKLISIFANASGFNGMVGGQMLDLQHKDQSQLSDSKRAKIYRLKTGEIFAAAVTAGATIGYASETEMNLLKNFAYEFGLAFQIRDDIDDNLSNINLEKEKARLELMASQARIFLAPFGKKANILNELLDFVLNFQSHTPSIAAS
jgi:farnesyl diphosphate synthase